MVPGFGHAGLIVVGALMLFWVGMLGLLWRRSLVGMLVGLLFAWVSVGLAGIGFVALHAEGEAHASGAVFVLCAAVLGGITAIRHPKQRRNGNTTHFYQGLVQNEVKFQSGQAGRAGDNYLHVDSPFRFLGASGGYQ